MGHVFDAPIHYVVLNDEENAFDADKLDKLINLYEKVESSTGPGVLVTISTSEKFFSTGFNLNYWMEDIKMNPMISAIKIQNLFQRVMAINMPSIAVINGHAYGAGFVLSLAHDFRIRAINKVTRLSKEWECSPMCTCDVAQRRRRVSVTFIVTLGFWYS